MYLNTIWVFIIKKKMCSVFSQSVSGASDAFSVSVNGGA